MISRAFYKCAAAAILVYPAIVRAASRCNPYMGQNPFHDTGGWTCTNNVNPDWFGCCPGAYCAIGCFYCAAGTYQGVDKFTGGTCTPCPPGTVAGQSAASCTPCPASFQPNADSSQCVQMTATAAVSVSATPSRSALVSATTTASATGSATSTSTMTPTATATSQIKCIPGYYSNTGFETCLPCSPGTYSSIFGAQTCLLCPAGTFGDHAGLTTAACSGKCAACTAGSTAPASQICAASTSRAVPTSLGLQIWPAAAAANPSGVDVLVAPLALCQSMTSLEACAAAYSVTADDGITRYAIGTAESYNVEAAEFIPC